MKTRVQFDLFFSSLTDEEVSMLKQLKSKSVKVNLLEKPLVIHECGKDEGKKCVNVVCY